MGVSTGAFSFSVCFGVLVVVDVIGNVLVILVVLYNRYMHSPVNYLLVNLAIADILIGLSILPQYILHHAFKHPQGVHKREFYLGWWCGFLVYPDGHRI